MKNGSGSATTVAGSAALPFVISTGGVMGLRPTQGDEKTGPVQQLLSLEAPPSPLSSRPEESWAFGPPKVMKNSFCSATTLNGSAALPFVISTGAPKERSGEICGAHSQTFAAGITTLPLYTRPVECWRGPAVPPQHSYTQMVPGNLSFPNRLPGHNSWQATAAVLPAQGAEASTKPEYMFRLLVKFLD